MQNPSWRSAQCQNARVDHRDRELFARLPELSTLISDAHTIITAALQPPLSLTTEPRAVQIRLIPGRSCAVKYIAGIAGMDGTTETAAFVASIGLSVPDHTAIVTAHGVDVAVWRVPHDPFLPGLAAVSEPGSAGRFLRQLGVDDAVTALRRRAYRPGRRAVMEIIAGEHRVYAKVVRPRKVRQLQELHAAIAPHAPIPRSLGWSETTGIAMLQALAGEPLRRAIERGTGSLPDPDALVGLLDAVQASDASGTDRPGLVAGVDRHAQLIAVVEPALGERAQALSRSIQDSAAPSARRIIHGDFHSSQIMVNNGHPTGLIDIDTVGVGEHADDLANLLAHIAVIAEGSPAARERAAAYGTDLTNRFDVLTDPRQLRIRVAAAIVGYATGPFRVQEPEWREGVERRIRLAEEWMESAASVRVR